MNHALEGHKLFPFIAWIAILCLAFFTYFLTLHLQEKLSELHISVEASEERLNQLEASQPVSSN